MTESDFWRNGPRALAALLFAVMTASPEHAYSVPSRIEIPPCRYPQFWPYAVDSPTPGRFLVHYQSADGDDKTVAEQVAVYLDATWDFQTGILGFPPPVSDEGDCGPDARFDVFLWRGHEGCAVDAVHNRDEEKFGPSCHPTKTYMLLDPWGKYGGEILRQTVGHEFNHAAQAVVDWNETLIALEMTATYVEQYYWDAFPRNILDFQRNPDRSLLWVNAGDDDPDSPTYLYMYGAALYVYFLRDRYFPDDIRFAARLWDGLGNADCTRNSPHIVNGIDRLLEPVGSSFMESAVEFARWRYYAGDRSDGRHFRAWPIPFRQLPAIAEANIALDGADGPPGTSGGVDLGPGLEQRYRVKKAPTILGSAYIEIRAQNQNQTAFTVELIPITDTVPVSGQFCPETRELRWIVQAVPGVGDGADGDMVDLSQGPARVAFATDGASPTRTLIVSLFSSGDFDPDRQCAQAFPFELRLKDDEP